LEPSYKFLSRGFPANYEKTLAVAVALLTLEGGDAELRWRRGDVAGFGAGVAECRL